ncbi:MAG: D-glycerate 3-kinase [Cellvibrionaceae bacterium]|jgi:D-glycerate 3-kinase
MNQEYRQQLSLFCQTHQLPDSYLTMAGNYFLPLADELAAMAKPSSTLLVGINGCQGSGKSTLSELLTMFLRHHHQLSVANLSIDDFYHTHAKRQQLADEIHPLFATRGVPGTHDVDLLQQSLDQLSKQSGWITIPRFDKSRDDRRSLQEWDNFLTPADIILLEGWCVGTSAQKDNELLDPINDLELDEDSEGIWRRAVNEAIKRTYLPLFQKIDTLIMIQAPSFACVYEWRRIQEDKLRQQVNEAFYATSRDRSSTMDETQLARFIQHYQRLTEHMLQTLPSIADSAFTLDRNHQVTRRIDNES